MSTLIQAQAIRLADYLAANPNSTRKQIERALGLTTYFHHVVGYIRNRAGSEVLVTKYDKSRGAYVYALALGKDEAMDYVKKRRSKVRGEIVNIIGIIDRTSAKFGEDLVIQMVRVQLQNAVNSLDVQV